METFYQHLNSQHPSIEFTVEKEREGNIAFLDVQIEKKEGKISTGVYRKSTHTDRCINYSSRHHPRIKAGVIACLRKIAEKVCDKQKTEISHLRKTNSYPARLINKGLSQPKHFQPAKEETADDGRQKLLYLPYV